MRKSLYSRSKPDTQEECETLLAEMIARVRTDIAKEKAYLKTETPVKI